MADIINLRQAKKAIKRKNKSDEAAENRLKHGRKKSEKHIDAQEKARQEKNLDGKLLDD